MYLHFDSNIWVTPFDLIFITAIVTAWACARRNAVLSRIDVSHVDFLIPVTLIVGVAGASVIAIFMSMDHTVAADMMNHRIRFRLFGMLVTGVVALFIYSRLTALSFRRLLDIFALPALVGLMIHRMGCFLAGCCWGDIASHDTAGSFTLQVQTLPFINSLTSGVRYLPGSFAFDQHVAMGLIEPGAMASLPVVPVQLYEAGLLLITVLLLLQFPWRNYPRGSIAIIVTCIYALMRFFIEYLRADGYIVLGNLTVTQLQCLLLLCSAVLLPGMLKRPGISTTNA
jgi:phosphatidylglycerol:prolipoprotein diacylglycerol transferase